MKIPKTQRRYCPYCKRHTEHKVIQNKRKAASSLRRGSKYRARDRGLARGHGNLGRYSKPAVTSWKRTGAKVSKKTDLRYKCTVCGRVHIIGEGKRTKRVTLV